MADKGQYCCGINISDLVEILQVSQRNFIPGLLHSSGKVKTLAFIGFHRLRMKTINKTVGKDSFFLVWYFKTGVGKTNFEKMLRLKWTVLIFCRNDRIMTTEISSVKILTEICIHGGNGN